MDPTTTVLYPTNTAKIAPFTRALIGISLAYIFASSLALFKIYYTQKHRKSVIPYLEDFLLLIGVISAISTIVYTWIGHFQHDFGANLTELSASDFMYMPKFIYAFSSLLLWVHTALRMSLLISIRRLYSPFKTSMRILCDVCMMLQFLITIGSYILWAFVKPSNDSSIEVILQRVANFLGAPLRTGIGLLGASLIVDSVVLLSPLPLVFQLKRISRVRQIQFGLIIGFGFMTISASVARLYEMVRLQRSTAVDIAWYFPVFILVTHVEVILAIFTTSLPTASFLFKWLYKLPRARNRISLRYNLARRSHNTATTSTTLATTTYDLEKSDPLSVTTYISSSNMDQHDVIDSISPPDEAVVPPQKFHDQSKILAIFEERANLSSHSLPRYPHQHLQMEDHSDVDEDDDNFFDMLVPSDTFFPHATQLGPRPSIVDT